MKKKSFEKKLLLGKSTVANLDKDVMDNALGGIERPVKETYACPYTLDIGDPICLSYVECPCSEWLNCVPSQNTSCHTDWAC